MLNSKLSYLLILPVLLLFSSCEEHPFDVDLSGIDVELESRRLDEQLQAAVQNKEVLSIEKLRATNGSFADDYIEDILRIGPADSTYSLEILLDFAQFQDTQDGFLAIDSIHGPQWERYLSELEKAFRYHSYHFPETKAPVVVGMHSGYNASVYPFDPSYLGIGLDYFLGANHPITQRLEPTVFPMYIKQKMESEYLVPSAMRGWLLLRNQGLYSDETLLSTIMYWGKMMLLMDACFPKMPDHLKIDYQAEEIKWCEEKERSIWIELSQHDMLYETKAFEIDRWITEGPFTKAGDIPQDSPARLGIWMGWQMMRDYHQAHPEMTLKQIIEESDYLKVLNTYRPE
ncbi:MAG: hypothetical protein O2984_01485 [Bacteroidetes bacterium]|nr:hypothetical protein [Bacteroidota bacterium]